MMTGWIKNRPYWWLDENGGYQVGKPLIVDCCFVWHRSVDAVLMQPSHAGKPVWAYIDDLHEYPSEPIEEPSVKGGA